MTIHQLRVPVATVQGTLALDLTPRQAPPPAGRPNDRGPLADVVAIEPHLRGDLDRWVPRFVQAAVEIVGGDRPSSQLLRWTSGEVYADLQRRAVLVARAGGHEPGARRVQPVRPHVESARTCVVGPRAAESSARVRYGHRSRAVALRFERRDDRWLCTALEFA